jgi:hypothetical protein
MTDLIDEVRSSFELAKNTEARGPVTVMSAGDTDMVPGFMAMKNYFDNRITIVARRGYRHFAGATLTHDADELLKQTADEMVTPLIATLFRAFSDGVMVGHRDNHLVRMAIHFGQADNLWDDDDFLQASKDLGSGFADDEEVCQYFAEYLMGGINHITHVTGFAHSHVEPTKIWDIWIMGGTACVCASFLAGHKLGTSWRERDVLDGIAIATEEAPVGSTGEDTDHH